MLGLAFSYTILSQFFFYKVKTEEHYNFHNFAATFQILCWRKFKDFSRPYIGIQGLLKDVWQSRTFQGLTLKYKDFSRLCEPCHKHNTPKTDPKIIESRQFKNFEREAFIDDIKETPFHLASLLDDPNDIVGSL